MARKKADNAPKANGNGAALGFEAKLWLGADKLRNNLDAAEYKHVVLGLIFLKYISDAFEEQHEKLLILIRVTRGYDPPCKAIARSLAGMNDDEKLSLNGCVGLLFRHFSHPVTCRLPQISIDRTVNLIRHPPTDAWNYASTD
jgi:HsdM N-terminal domain